MKASVAANELVASSHLFHSCVHVLLALEQVVQKFMNIMGRGADIEKAVQLRRGKEYRKGESNMSEGTSNKTDQNDKARSKIASHRSRIPAARTNES